MTLEELKRWFEVNYLDGDKIQEGQMNSSEDCFNAVSEAFQLGKEVGRGEVEVLVKEMAFYGVNDNHPNNELVGKTDLLKLLASLKKQ